MRKIFALMMALAMVLSLTACGSNKYGGSKFESGAAMDMGMTEEAPAAPEEDFDYGYMDEAKPSEEPGEGGGFAAYENAGVKLIRRASLEIETMDFDAACKSMEALVSSMGGYIEDSSLYQGSFGSTYRSANYTVRVPSEKYSAFLNQVSADESCYLVQKNESTEDVGQEYFDTETRLNTLRTKLERLEALLKEAKKMEDIITLEESISETTYQIDRFTSKLNRYDSLIGFSTFNISISQVRALSDGTTESFGERMKKAFERGCGNFVEGTQDFVLFVAENIFTLLVYAVIIILLVQFFRWAKRRKGITPKKKGFFRKKGAKTPAQPNEEQEEK